MAQSIVYWSLVLTQQKIRQMTWTAEVNKLRSILGETQVDKMPNLKYINQKKAQNIHISKVEEED